MFREIDRTVVRCGNQDFLARVLAAQLEQESRQSMFRFIEIGTYLDRLAVSRGKAVVQKIWMNANYVDILAAKGAGHSKRNNTYGLIFLSPRGIWLVADNEGCRVVHLGRHIRRIGSGVQLMLLVLDRKNRAESHVLVFWAAGLGRNQLTQILSLIKKSMQFLTITEVVSARVHLRGKVSKGPYIMIGQSGQSVVTGK